MSDDEKPKDGEILPRLPTVYTPSNPVAPPRQGLLARIFSPPPTVGHIKNAGEFIKATQELYETQEAFDDFLMSVGKRREGRLYDQEQIIKTSNFSTTKIAVDAEAELVESQKRLEAIKNPPVVLLDKKLPTRAKFEERIARQKDSIEPLAKELARYRNMSEDEAEKVSGTEFTDIEGMEIELSQRRKALKRVQDEFDAWLDDNED